MKPVGVSTFLGDDKVQDIINGNTGGVIVDPGYENPEDIPPVLALEDGTELTAGDEVSVTLGNSVTIRVTNADVYDAIEWFYNGDDLTTLEGVEVSGVKGEEVAINTGIFPYGEGTYQLAVKGTANGKPYSTEIFIKIEEE
jgi:hypothetical protein